MTAYTVAVGDIGKYEVALTANTEDVVTFGGGVADPIKTKLSRVDIIHHSGTKPVYVRFGGTATVKGTNCYMVPPGTAANIPPTSEDDTAVHVISEADAVYSVANGG